MRKKRILVVSEFSQLNTGYSVYSRNLLQRLYDSGKYEVAELACYYDPSKDPRGQGIPWQVFPNCPRNEQEAQLFGQDPTLQFGKARFEETALNFLVDTVITFRDPWHDKFVMESPFRKYYNWGYMSPVDGECQQLEWLHMYANADGFFTYQDWSKDLINKESEGKIKVIATASPVAEECYVGVADKVEHKKMMGFENVKIVGVVARNQGRKQFPDIFKSFRHFLDITGRKDVLLYCHSSNKDAGWNLASLLKEHKLCSKVLFTYVCFACNYAYPSFYSDEWSVCPRCGQPKANCSNVQVGVPSSTLANIYNLMDIYIQWANCEGLGMPTVEAAACNVPVITVDYSAMADTGRKLNGEPITPKAYYKELATGRMMAVPDNDALVNKLIEFFNSPTQIQLLKGKEARKGFEEHFSSWERTIQTWVNWIDSLPLEHRWNYPPRIHNAAQLNQANTNLSNADFVRWCIVNVLAEPERLDTYLQARILKDLNCGSTTLPAGHLFDENSVLFSKPHHRAFTRNDVWEGFNNLNNFRNYWENQRINRMKSLNRTT